MSANQRLKQTHDVLPQPTEATETVTSLRKLTKNIKTPDPIPQAGIDAAVSAKMTAIAIGSPEVLSNATKYIPSFTSHPYAKLAEYFQE